jgi:hypothetical protein
MRYAMFMISAVCRDPSADAMPTADVHDVLTKYDL